MKPLATIGYESTSLEAVIGKLTAAQVEILLDVRAIASSRRAGFSKTVLSESLKAAGIDYLHLRALGTPKAGRVAVRKGRVAEMRTIYEDHLAEPQAQTQLDLACEIAVERRAALLCYEADHAHCHRSILADRLRERRGMPVIHL
jgi:uncharacterized protein (DUF488 family)